jgi:predicted GH43/DUF377 family glycosyl hydrolase
MKWRKLGQVFCPAQNFPWMQSHAANTVAEPLGNGFVRVYFSCRDEQQRAHVGWVVFELSRPENIVAIADKPVLGPGAIGTFDDSGTSLACIQSVGAKRYMYYLGWNLGVTVPWRNSIGLAEWDEGRQEFVRVSQAPVLDRNHLDPYSVSYPFVLQEGPERFRMWYGSNLAWGKEQTDMAHLLKYAESKDGIHWQPTGRIAVPFKNPAEYALSRPWVIAENGVYRMWYSYRGSSYRIGYAESDDGIEFTRRDEQVGIDVSSDGWDSEMIEYPCLFKGDDGQRYMTYNGNRYGKTGFGLAVLESE